MSCLVTRPEMPVPGTSRMSTLCSAAILRTTGDERVCRSSSTRHLARAALVGRAAAGAPGPQRARARRRCGAAVGAAAVRCRRGRRRGCGCRRGGDGRARRRRGRRRRCGCGRRRSGGPAAAPPAAGAARRRRRRRRHRLALRRDHAHDGVDRHRRARLDADLLEHAGGRRRDLGVDLVGGDLEERLVALHLVADLLHPLGDGALGDRLAHLRHDDVGHGSSTLDPLHRQSKARVSARRHCQSVSYSARMALPTLLGVGQEVLLERRRVGHRRVRRGHAHDGRVQVLEGALRDEGARPRRPGPPVRVASCRTITLPVFAARRQDRLLVERQQRAQVQRPRPRCRPRAAASAASSATCSIAA